MLHLNEKSKSKTSKFNGFEQVKMQPKELRNVKGGIIVVEETVIG